MKVPDELALMDHIFWNKHTLSLQSDGPVTFIWRNLFAGLPKLPVDVDLSGQTVLITGGNGGVGFAAAKAFVKLGADVILAVRTVAKGEEAKELLLKEKPDAKVEVRELDIASFDSIKSFAKKLGEEVPRVDIAILNAAVYNFSFQLSSYGYEQQLQVNTLGNFMLSLLLLPTLEKSSALRERPTRLLLITSEVHAFTDFDKTTQPDVYRVETENSQANFSHGRPYQLSKLFGILLTRELAMRVDPSKIIIAEASPGYCSTGLLNEVKGVLPWITNKLFTRSPDDGARIYVHVAVSTKDEEFSGSYFRSAVPAETSRYTRSNAGKTFGKELWQQSVELLNKETSGAVDLAALPLSG